MCDYLSFLVDLKGDNFKFEPNLQSHSATHELHSLDNDAWRECEWTSDDDGDSLSIRTHADDPHDVKWLKACVLAKWPTRKALEDWLCENVPSSRVMNRMARGGHESTLTGGDRSTLTGGDRSTLTGGGGSTLTGGHGSTLTGGYRSTLTGGDRSTLTGGYRSTLTGGDGSTLTGGYRSTLTGGDGSTLTGGDESTLSFWWYRADDQTWQREIVLIGRDGFKPATKYKCDDTGRVVEVPVEQEVAHAS